MSIKDSLFLDKKKIIFEKEEKNEKDFGRTKKFKEEMKRRLFQKKKKRWNERLHEEKIYKKE